MAAVVQTGTGNVTTINGQNVTSVTVAKPANTADGDLFLALVYHRNTGATLTAPSGWTWAKQDTVNATYGVAYKTVPSAAAETATNYTFSTSGGSGRMTAGIARVTGADLTAPLDATGTTSGTTGTTSLTMPSVTAGVAGALLVAVETNNGGSTVSAFTPDPAMTGIVQINVKTPDGTGSCNTQFAQQQLTSTGATGTRTCTMSPAANNSSGFLMTIKAGVRSGTGTITGTAALTGTGSKAASGTGTLSRTATLTSTGSKGASGSGSLPASATLTGAGYSPQVKWAVSIDWDADGFMEEDDVTCQALERTGLSMQYGRDQLRELSPMAAGAADLELDNSSRDYSPDNLASPLAGRVLPARPIRFRASSGQTVLNGNPDFATGIAGWTPNNVTLSYDTSVVHPDGAGSMKLVPSGVSTAGGAGSALFDITPGATYGASLWAYSPAGWSDIRVLVNWYDASSTFLSSTLSPASTVPAAGWTEIEEIFTAPTNAARAAVWAWQASSPSAADVWYAWNIRLAPDGAVATLFRGFTDEYEVNPGRSERSVSISALDAVAKLKGAEVTTPLYQGIRTGTAIGYVLDALGWPATARDLDPGATTVRWWWAQDEDAFDAVQKLVQSEGPPAMLTSDELGRIVFRDRHHRLLDPGSTTAQETFTDTSEAEPSFGAMSYDHGWRDVVNSVSVKVDELDPAAEPETVWQSESQVSIGANATLTLNLSLDSPAVRPSVSYAVLAGSASSSLTVDSGQTLTLTLTAGAGGALLSDLQVLGQPVTAQRSYTILMEDQASIDEYGKRSLTYEVPWAGFNDASAVAALVLGASAQRRPIVTITLQSGTELASERLTQQLVRNLSDRVHVREPETCVDHDFHIEQIAHKVLQGGLVLETTFGMERAIAQAVDVFRFDDSAHGFDQGVFGSVGLTDPANVFVFDVAGHGFNDGVFAT